MKSKISITLSHDLLMEIQRMAGRSVNRSELIEHALQAYMGDLHRKERDAQDLLLLNKLARRLNKEAEDVLSYQAEV